MHSPPGYTVTERVMQLFSREAEEANTSIESIIAKRTEEIPLGKLVQPKRYRRRGFVLLLTDG
ncbi:MAG: hypothetical protein CM1200mP41_35640 [Gammaproteobacteria bacterium]|nr:MAG: hypothetical protein CM1200mP41_35640 [Gammaproteobacteria bacterium]